jgi:hypothetical protein
MSFGTVVVVIRDKFELRRTAWLTLPFQPSLGLKWLLGVSAAHAG